MSEITRDDIIREFPLRETMESYGVELRNVGGTLMCICPFHADKNPSMQYYKDQHFHCHGCGKHGTVVDFMAFQQNQDSKAMFKFLADKLKTARPKGEPKPKVKERYTIVDTYPYRDEHGKARYFVDRLEAPSGKKKFAQWRKGAGGNRTSGIEGVERLLYRFPEVLKSGEVVIAEGEKCVHALESMGYVATTNSGGSGGWFDGYAEHFADKHVTILPDSDEPGQKWLAKVKNACAGKVETLRIINMPKPYNDIADVEDQMGTEKATDFLMDLESRTTAVHRGIDLPILSSGELVQKYEHFVRQDKANCIDLGCWIHDFAEHVRPLYPGDVVTIISETGVGKTAVLQNIALAIAPKTVLFFEIELTAELMAERNMSMVHNVTAGKAEYEARQGNTFNLDAMKHVWTCVQSKIDCEQIESIAKRAELKIGSKPSVIMIDYIGLMRGGAGKRYERMTTIAEDIKILAKATNTIVFVTSQVKRDINDSPGLHDAKDSGQIEASSALVIGASRPSRHEILLEILKQTKGQAGAEILCRYDGAQSRITAL